MEQIQVSIGRNTAPGVPMDDSSWLGFQSAIVSVLWDFTRGGSRWAEVHYGAGQWEDEPEESAHVTMLDVFCFDRNALTVALGRIAKRYGQDSVALTVTEPDLISAL